MRTESHPAVALFDVDEPPALACLTSLAQQGVPVVAYGSRRFGIARFSKHTRDYRRCPSPTQHAAFSSWLKARLQSGEITRVCPTSDLIVFHCAELRQYFPPEVQASITTLQAMQDALMKPRLAQACAAVGIAVPRTLEPGSLDEALAMADDLGYPLVVKPKSHIGVGSWYRGALVHNREDLSAHYQWQPPQAGGEELLQRYPALHWPMLQQYIAGADRTVYGVSGFRTGDGSSTAAASIKTDFWPAHVGIGMVSETYDNPELVAMTCRLMDHLDIRGPFALEFLRRDDEYLAIDLNPRLNGRVTLEIARGHALPWIWYQLTLGRAPAAPAPAFKHPLHWRHPLPYTTASLTRLLRWPGRRRQLRRYWAALRTPAVSVIEGLDLLPTLAFLLLMFRHPTTLVKSYWREKSPRTNRAARL